MSLASIGAVFGTMIFVGLVARLANEFGVDTWDDGVLSMVSVSVGAVLGVVLGVTALRRSLAYPPSVVRTQAIAGIVVSVLVPLWMAYDYIRGTGS